MGPISLNDAMHHSSRYNYERLSCRDSIRIVELLPEQHGEEIQINLYETNLRGTPQYETLSYEGSEVNDSHLRLNEGATLFVTINLVAALRRVRYPTVSRYLWIDAICINHEDIEEKTQQATIISAIYRRCSKVLVWIGEVGPETSTALSRLPELVQKQEVFEAEKESFFRECSERELSVQQTRSGWAAKLDILKMDCTLKINESDPLWQGLCDIFSRTYFQRLSIIQEIVLSPAAVILCGQDQCDWNRLCLAARYCRAFLKLLCDWIIDKIIQISNLQDNLAYRYPDYYEQQLAHFGDTTWFLASLEAIRAADLERKKCLSSLLVNFASSKVINPCDRVWGLLSLTNDDTRNLTKPNYALSIGQTYRQAMEVAFTENLGVALLLKFASPCLSQMPGVPSWVPDFTCDLSWDVSIVEPPTDDYEIVWDDEEDRSKDVFDGGLSFTTDGDILLADGVILGTIEYCTYIVSPAEMCHFEVNYTDCGPIVIANANLPNMHDFTPIGSTREEVIQGKTCPWFLEEAFVKILESANGQVALHSGNTSLDDCRIRASREKRNFAAEDTVETTLRGYWFDQWNTINRSFQLLQSDAVEEPPTGYSRGENDSEFWTQQYHCAQQKWSSHLYVHKHGRQILKTKEGWLAIGPAGINSIEVGDIVASLGDRSRRFALRPLEDGTYTLRGEVVAEKYPAFLDRRAYAKFRFDQSNVKLSQRFILR